MFDPLNNDSLTATIKVNHRALYTFNRMERLSRPESWKRTAEIRYRAAEAWRYANRNRAFIPHRYTLTVDTLIGDRQYPDTDSSAWVLKRILDGAIDAGVIGDDTHGTIRAVTLTAARYRETIPAKAAHYVATLTPILTPMSEDDIR